MQQHLPFTVLKRGMDINPDETNLYETVATTPTVYGIETTARFAASNCKSYNVATTPTVYGIETLNAIKMLNDNCLISCNNTYRLRY